MLKLISRYVIVLVFFCSLSSLFAENKNRLNIATKSDKVDVFRKFVVFIPSFNNETYCKDNLNSVFEQTYENYRVVYFDDKSTDSTYERVLKIVMESGKSDKVIIVHNQFNQKNIKNLYDCVHQYCSDDEIVVNLDGDDFFAHPDVLKNLNAYYQSDDVWMTWGSYKVLSTNELGEHAAPISKKELKYGDIRSLPYCYSHLKTFYAGLFKKVKKEDLLFRGEFIKLVVDLPTMFPLVEMARSHAYYIPEILYIYNDKNPLSERNIVARQDCIDVSNYVFSLPRYDSLSTRDW